MHFEEFLARQEVVIALLFIASLVGILAQRFRVPYTVGLVIVGLGLTLLRPEEFEIPPEVILSVLVPPLIFEAAYHIQWRSLRRNLVTILALAIPGVIITMVLVGGMITLGTGIAFPVALVFGSLMAATDPVAVVALFRSLGAPKRLQVLLEGESLFNDGTAIVIYNLMLVVAINGTFNLSESLINFGRVAGGGIIVGLGLGALISWIIGRINEPLIETALMTVLAFGAYIMAEKLHVSGVLAVVVAGLVNGNVGSQNMSPKTQIVVFNFWEFAAFLANSFAFLVIGLSIDLRTLADNLLPIFIAIAAVLGARAVVVYGITAFVKTLPKGWKTVIFWGGLRGAISLALALSLPASLGAERVQLRAMAFGVVLFTLLVQGTSMQKLLHRFGVIEGSTETKQAYERRHARAIAARAAYDHLRDLNKAGLISEHTWEHISPVLWQQVMTLTESVREVMHDAPDIYAEELDTSWRESLTVQRSVYTKLRTDGVINNEIFSQLVSEVDVKLTSEKSGWENLLHSDNNTQIRHLAAAIVKEGDMERASLALNKVGFPTSRLPTAGGILGRQNATMLIGIPEGSEQTVIEVLKSNTSSRMEFDDADVLTNLAIPLPTPTKVTIGGVTLFMFDVDRYEEF